MSLQVTSSKLSKVGIKREGTHGTIATGTYRGLLVTGFTSVETVAAETFQVIQGSKGMTDQNKSGSHQEVTFSIIAGSGSATMATMIDIIDMIMGNDVVSGADPFTHTFDLNTSPTPMPSWTLFHDDNNSNYRVFRGFVANTVTINIDKSVGAITIDVAGMAWEEKDDSDKSPVFVAAPAIYTPRTADLLIGASRLENFTTATIELSGGTVVHNTINATAFPSQIDGETLNCIVTMEGLWNEGTSQQSDNIRTAWINKTLTSNLIVQFGPTAVDDFFKLTIPFWAITSHTAKDLATGEFLPQSVTAEAVHQADAATSGFKIEIFNKLGGDWDTL